MLMDKNKGSVGLFYGFLSQSCPVTSFAVLFVTVRVQVYSTSSKLKYYDLGRYLLVYYVVAINVYR